jgi:hypothetical protein
MIRDEKLVGDVVTASFAQIYDSARNIIAS